MQNIQVPINDELMFDFVSEEGHMLELDESIEAIDAAIEYKNDRLLGVGSLTCPFLFCYGNCRRDRSIFLKLFSSQYLARNGMIELTEASRDSSIDTESV